MSSLGPDPTREEVIEELNFQYVIRSTLEPESDDYEEQNARIIGIINDLKEKLRTFPSASSQLDGVDESSDEPSGECHKCPVT